MDRRVPVCGDVAGAAGVVCARGGSAVGVDRCPTCGQEIPLTHECQVGEIQRAVALHYGIPLAALRGTSRRREFVRPRQVAMYLAHHLTRKRLSVIARAFMRDRTTVQHGITRIGDRRQVESGLHEDIELLRRLLAGP